MTTPESPVPFRVKMGLIAGRLADIAETSNTLAQKCAGILVIYPVEGNPIKQRKLREEEESLRKEIEKGTWIDFVYGDIRDAEDRQRLKKAFKVALGRTQGFDTVVLNSKDPSEDLNGPALSGVLDDIRPYMHIGGEISLHSKYGK